MEGLYNTYDQEEGPEKDDEDTPEIKDKPKKEHKAEKKGSEEKSFFEELFEKSEEKEPKKADESEAEPINLREEDRAPELDAEAPYNHLGEVERAAITKSLAADRLETVQETESPVINAETIGAISFLENVQANPDMELAEQQTLTEMGIPEKERLEAAPAAEYVETESTEAIDPDSLRVAARQELLGAPPAAPAAENIDLGTSPTTKKDQKEHQPSNKRDRRLQDSLVDYVVGRRSGRMTEHADEDRLEHQLSQEVSDIKQELAKKEENIRELAREQAKPIAEIPPTTKEVETEEAIYKPEVGKEKPVPESSDLPPTLLTPETEISLSKQPERIVEPPKELSQETSPLEKLERPKEEKHRAIKAELDGISAHTMKRKDLIEFSKQIKIEDSSLYHLYDRHMIGEKGLRRVIAEFLRGGDYTKILRRELLEKEKDFERDPKLRDQASAVPVAPLSSQLDGLLKRSGIEWDESPQAHPQAQQPTTRDSLLSNVKKPLNPLRLVADLVMVILILAVAAIITYILINRAK